MNTKETAEKLRIAAKQLEYYADIVEGKEIDLTGIGIWNMFRYSLEEAMPDIQIVDKMT